MEITEGNKFDRFPGLLFLQAHVAETYIEH